MTSLGQRYEQLFSDIAAEKRAAVEAERERIAKLADDRGYGQFAHDLRNLNSEAK